MKSCWQKKLIFSLTRKIYLNTAKEEEKKTQGKKEKVCAQIKRNRQNVSFSSTEQGFVHLSAVKKYSVNLSVLISMELRSFQRMWFINVDRFFFFDLSK